MAHIINLTEMDKLREMLDNNNIKWHDNTVYNGCMILARTQGDYFNVVCGDNAMGRADGLLEVWTVIMEEPERYCTAEESLTYILDVAE